MTKAEKLVQLYEQAEKKLTAIIRDKQQHGSAAAYHRSLLRQVQRELVKLKKESHTMVSELVNGSYQKGLEEVVLEAQAVGMEPEQVGVLMMSGLNVSQIELLMENADYDFNRAIDLVGRRIRDGIREAAIEAAAEKLTVGQTVRQMQKNLEQKLIGQGLTAVEYANGSRMPLGSYAEMAARSTTAETQNTAKLTQGKAWGFDLVAMTTHSPTCAVCAMYQGRVYALTKEAANGKYGLEDGTVLRFPYLYDTAFASGYNTIHPNCRHRIAIFPINAYTDEEMRHWHNISNTPFEDTRSDRERKAYSAAVAKRRRLLADRRQYARIKAALPDEAPKSFAGFVRMKTARSERWQNLMRDYRYILRVAKQQESGIIEPKKVSKMSIRSIDQPIEQRNTGKGNPNAILTFGAALNNRQRRLLEGLTGFDSRVVVPKKSVKMSDLSALTAYTGDEFAMFTKGGERLIIRGNDRSVNIGIDEAREMAEMGYRWSGHTHPGVSGNCLFASDGDRLVLQQFKQSISAIYNSKGQFVTFEKMATAIPPALDGGLRLRKA